MKPKNCSNTLSEKNFEWVYEATVKWETSHISECSMQNMKKKFTKVIFCTMYYKLITYGEIFFLVTLAIVSIFAK